MKPCRFFLLLTALVVMGAGWARGASVMVDLRTPDAERRGAGGQEGACLQSARFPAGAASAGELSVGDELTFLLFQDTEIRVRLASRMESPLGGEAFLGEVEGYGGVKNAVVLRTDEGLTVDIQDFERGRVYTIVSDAGGVVAKEVDPSFDAVEPTDGVDPGEFGGKGKADAKGARGAGTRHRRWWTCWWPTTGRRLSGSGRTGAGRRISQRWRSRR